MFDRIAQAQLTENLAWSPAVAILGPRQVGKTTLAQSLLQSDPQAIYLDLENPQDQTRLGEGVLFTGQRVASHHLGRGPKRARLVPGLAR